MGVFAISTLAPVGPIWEDQIGSGPAGIENSNWIVVWTGQGYWDGTEWDSQDQSFTRHVAIVTQGSWYIGYRPTKIRIGINGAPFTPNPDGNIALTLKFGSGSFGTHVLTSIYKDLDEYDIDPSWYIDSGPGDGGDLFRVLLRQSTARGDYQVTSVEFLI